MTVAGTNFNETRALTDAQRDTLRRGLLTCGIIGAVLYPLSDIFASLRYPGFSYRDMAVSELFAIGAPTSSLVVSLFTSSSTLLLFFGIGIWMSANGRKSLKWIGALMILNTIDALILWNFFPMHMRGLQPGFTDMMHGLLAIDPFVLALVVIAAVAFPGRFRVYTISTVVFTLLMIAYGTRYIPEVIANEPTPWMGASERAGQYANNLWYAVFAVLLMQQKKVMPQKRAHFGINTR